jgi:hypothetical protein
MWKKIVQRVPVSSDPENDLVALIDMIELELGFHAGGENVRVRLSNVVSDIRQSGGVVSSENESALLAVIEHLAKIERLLSDGGSEPEPGADRD